LKQLTESIGKLSKLEILDLEDNALTVLHKEIGDLTDLGTMISKFFLKNSASHSTFWI
jgi:Leucine-rich repeat (LRR) protein